MDTCHYYGMCCHYVQMMMQQQACRQSAPRVNASRCEENSHYLKASFVAVIMWHLVQGMQNCQNRSVQWTNYISQVKSRCFDASVTCPYCQAWGQRRRKKCIAPISLFLPLSSKSMIFQFLKVNAKRMMSIGAVSRGNPLNWIFPDQYHFLPAPCKHRLVAYCLI